MTSLGITVLFVVGFTDISGINSVSEETAGVDDSIVKAATPVVSKATADAVTTLLKTRLSQLA